MDFMPKGMCRVMKSRPRSRCARNSSACQGSRGRSSAPSSPRDIAYILRSLLHQYIPYVHDLHVGHVRNARTGGFLDARGRLRGANRVLLVDSLGAMFGGLANSSSNTTYIESAAGVADGARTGLAPVVTGLLFLAAMFLSPLASVIPAQATAPALIIVGFFMMGIVRDIPWDDYEQAIPAFMTMLAMPFTWSITNGIGAGFVTYAVIKLLRGRGRELHWMIYLACAAFTVYFCLPLIESAAK